MRHQLHGPVSSSECTPKRNYRRGPIGLDYEQEVRGPNHRTFLPADHEVPEGSFIDPDRLRQKLGIFHAIEFPSRKQIMLQLHDQDFDSYATPWEKLFSPLCRSLYVGHLERIGKPWVPVVDVNGTVIGYFGHLNWYYAWSDDEGSYVGQVTPELNRVDFAYDDQSVTCTAFGLRISDGYGTYHEAGVDPHGKLLTWEWGQRGGETYGVEVIIGNLLLLTGAGYLAFKGLKIGLRQGLKLLVRGGRPVRPTWAEVRKDLFTNVGLKNKRWREHERKCPLLRERQRQATEKISRKVAKDREAALKAAWEKGAKENARIIKDHQDYVRTGRWKMEGIGGEGVDGPDEALKALRREYLRVHPQSQMPKPSGGS